MISKEHPGLLRRLLETLAGALHRGFRGKSGRDYMKQFNGSDEYWSRATAAHLGWPQNQPPKPDAAKSTGPKVGGVAGLPPEPEFEPVHGWTRRQFEDYLARNPGYRPTYEAELRKRCCATAPEVNGPSLDWFGPRRINDDKAARSS
jgi:hypothetical protein